VGYWIDEEAASREGEPGMNMRRAEALGFCVVLAACVGVFFHEALRPDRVLSPADVLLVEASFRDPDQPDYEPMNRLLMDPVLQFQPWLALNRAEIQAGRLPLWNPYAGCGVPHLANGQSAVFDPFNLLIHFGPMPTALAWVAALRLWFAGVGAFLLARSWGLNVWGRWFAGLVYPFCGFLVVWLLYPVTPAAIWLPWILLATDRTVRRPSLRAAAWLAVCAGGTLVAGHVQTSSHVLLAAGGLAVWRLALDPKTSERRGAAALAWGAGIALGLGLAAAQIVPLGVYLTKSPVWSERHREHPPWWELTRPRLPESACVGLPYLYGSQRRGHPNLGRGLGLDNMNESAGGYAGLATLIWLAPLGLIGRRRPLEVRFLALLLIVGAMGAYRIPPVDNILRALPVIGVTDNRRMTLWVAFALTFLGAFGMERLSRGTIPSRRWALGWLAGAAALMVAASAVSLSETMIRERAERHYAQTTGEIAPEMASRRADRQIKAALDFTPWYLRTVAGELLLLAAMVEAARRSARARRMLPLGSLGVVVVELFGFGMGLNPAIDRDLQDRESAVIARLREELGKTRRALGVGEELPPNVLMRFGLADPRNYDSIELSQSLDWFEPLYEPTDEARSSRRTVSWETVRRALPILEQSAVGAVVGATAPPEPDLFERVERVDDVWIAWLKSAEWVEVLGAPSAIETSRPSAGSIHLKLPPGVARRVVIRETWDPGWLARVDGAPARVERHLDAFMSVSIDENARVVELDYVPWEARLGLWISACSACVAILGLTARAWFWIYGMVGGGLGRNRARRLESARSIPPEAMTGTSF